MPATFSWKPQGHQLFWCESAATAWDELRPALVASWLKFAELMNSEVFPSYGTKSNSSIFATRADLRSCTPTTNILRLLRSKNFSPFPRTISAHDDDFGMA